MRFDFPYSHLMCANGNLDLFLKLYEVTNENFHFNLNWNDGSLCNFVYSLHSYDRNKWHFWLFVALICWRQRKFLGLLFTDIMGTMDILFVSCTDMMWNNDILVVSRTSMMGLMTHSVVCCTDMMGTNEIVDDSYSVLMGKNEICFLRCMDIMGQMIFLF